MVVWGSRLNILQLHSSSEADGFSAPGQPVASDSCLPPSNPRGKVWIPALWTRNSIELFVDTESRKRWGLVWMQVISQCKKFWKFVIFQRPNGRNKSCQIINIKQNQPCRKTPYFLLPFSRTSHWTLRWWLPHSWWPPCRQQDPRWRRPSSMPRLPRALTRQRPPPRRLRCPLRCPPLRRPPSRWRRGWRKPRRRLGCRGTKRRWSRPRCGQWIRLIGMPFWMLGLPWLPRKPLLPLPKRRRTQTLRVESASDVVGMDLESCLWMVAIIVQPFTQLNSIMARMLP